MQKQVTTDTTIFYWESAGELAGATKNIARERISWTGETRQQTIDRATFGNTDLVAEAQSLIDSFSVSIDTELRSWQSSPAGAFVVVPEVLAGFPMPMRRRIVEDTDIAPLRVVVDTTSSGGIDHGDLQRRGAAILALVMSLIRVRPVELVVISALGGRSGKAAINVIAVGSRPLDMALACNALCSIGLCRTLGYAQAETVSQITGSWAWGLYPGAGYNERMRGVLELNEQDLFIPPIFIRDESVNDPKQWLLDTLSTLGINTEGGN